MNVNVCIFLYIKSNDDESSNIPNRIYHIELDVRLCCLYESAHTEYLPLYKSSIWKTILFFSFLFCSMKQAMNDVDDNDGGNNSTKIEKKKDCIRGMKYKRLSASQSSHLCIQFTVLHKYIQRYGHHQNIGNTTTVRSERTQHDTATRKRDRMSELTVSPSHTRHTNFHKFLLFFKKKNFCPFPFAHHLVDIVNLQTEITTEQLAFGHVYGTISVNQTLIDHFTLVANWFSSFSTDIQTLRETVLHLSPCSLSQSQSHSYILTHSPPNAWLNQTQKPRKSCRFRVRVCFWF